MFEGDAVVVYAIIVSVLAALIGTAFLVFIAKQMRFFFESDEDWSKACSTITYVGIVIIWIVYGINLLLSFV